MTRVKLDQAQALDLLRGMIRIRRLEEKCYERYTQEHIRGFLHLHDGDEAVAVGVSAALEERDRVVSTCREHGHALARVMSVESALAEMYGKATGCAGGRGGSMHLFDTETNLYGGCYAVSMGLPAEFGEDRIRDTPLAEGGFTGAGIGAALAGMRPIVEIMTVDFSLLALDQILNTAAPCVTCPAGGSAYRW